VLLWIGHRVIGAVQLTPVFSWQSTR
jgi:hypothetical protein